jgi:pSer/pThr/pTyr-binding forkhead associated (FHA) protein
VVVADPELSRRHVSVKPVPGSVEITDLGSLNGTTVSGERISDSVTVGNGAEIRIGQTTITVEMPDAGKTKLSSRISPEHYGGGPPAAPAPPAVGPSTRSPRRRGSS